MLFVLLITILIFLSVSVYVGWNLIHPTRDPISETPGDYGLIYENVDFHSLHDGILLKGWWIPDQISKETIKTNKSIIFSHGYGNNRTLHEISLLNLGKRLTQEGYNVLCFDYRASGESGGSHVSIGELEKFDLLSAVNFVEKEKKPNSIYLMGWSMGSVASILAGVESDYVKGIIADSPFANLKNYLRKNLPHWSNLPSFPFTAIILATLPIMVGVDMDHVNPAEAVTNLGTKPLLLIHSKDDQAIPFENSLFIYNAVPNKDIVDIWLTSGCSHIESYITHREAYEEKILSFLNNH